MKLSEMRDLLSSRGIQLTKSLGQNFLHDANQLEKIVSYGELSPSDHILEIGPGLGPLTEHLLDSGAHVLAIEKDQRLVEVLRDRFKNRPNFELLHDDALDYLRAPRRDWSNFKLIANLPYSVASPILVELATSPQPPERLVATLQLEVVQRIMATPDDDSYGQLSLFLQVRYKPVEYFKLPGSSFFPPPEVDSACVLLRRRKEELIDPALIPTFMRVVKLAFSARRKMMVKLLKQNWPAERILEALERMQIRLDARAEMLSLEQFVELTKALAR